MTQSTQREVDWFRRIISVALVVCGVQSLVRVAFAVSEAKPVGGFDIGVLFMCAILLAAFALDWMMQAPKRRVEHNVEN